MNIDIGCTPTVDLSRPIHTPDATSVAPSTVLGQSNELNCRRPSFCCVLDLGIVWASQEFFSKPVWMRSNLSKSDLLPTMDETPQRCRAEDRLRQHVKQAV